MTRIIEITRAAALVYGTATMSLVGAPAGVQATTPGAPAQAAPETPTPPVPAALTGTASAQPGPNSWHWEVQRLGRRVIRVIPVR